MESAGKAVMNKGNVGGVAWGKVVFWGSIIGPILFLIIGVILMATDESTKWTPQSASVTAAVCSDANNSKCDLTLSYTVNSNTYNGNLRTTEKHKVTDLLTIYVSNKDPTKIQQFAPKGSAVGILFVVCSLLILFLHFLNLIMHLTSDTPSSSYDTFIVGELLLNFVFVIFGSIVR